MTSGQWNLWNLIQANRPTAERERKRHESNHLKKIKTAASMTLSPPDSIRLRKLFSRLGTKHDLDEKERIRKENVKILREMGSARPGPYHPERVGKVLLGLRHSASIDREKRNLHCKSENARLLHNLSQLSKRSSIDSWRMVDTPPCLRDKFRSNSRRAREEAHSGNVKLERALRHARSVYSSAEFEKDYTAHSERSMRVSQNSDRSGCWGSPAKRPRSTFNNNQGEDKSP